MKKDELNSLYKALDTKARAFCKLFSDLDGVSNCSYGYYNGHFYKNSTGEYEMCYFPIPVVSVENLCDIEIDCDFVSVSSKLKREAALSYDYSKLEKYNFEVYGVESYLDDFYTKGQSFDTLVSNIEKSKEKEIGFSFEFSNDISSDQLYDFVMFLKKEYFYY